MHRGFSRPLLNAGVAAQHPFDVAVEDRLALAERLRQDRAGSRAADTRQRHQHIERIGEPAAVLCHDLLRGAVQVAAAGVVAEAGPVLQDFVDRRAGQ